MTKAEAMTYPVITPREPGLYHLAAEDYPDDTEVEADLHLLDVLGEVADRRYEQDRRWGGPEHDDQHTTPEWEDVILRHACELTNGGIAMPGYRSRLITVAALCVAAAQAWDRLEAAPGEAGEHVHPEPVEG